MKKFNIIHEPFIKVRFLDNTKVRLSLRDIILESYRISEIVSDSVTEAAAIRRFLLALFIR
ncbi:MAG: type I-E CRISPR-associated protein Cse1/CasA, partial [Candidatus Kapabacteria bacterium]|nr:type I-E CRISPR-associated protein Cse1/CasA [Candidatus Kapabacteria bacterium]